MPFREVIKNFELVRSMIRDFYIYGFKRDGSDVRIAGKSKRTDSDERYRIESWLEEYIDSHTDDAGKSYFLSIDSRSREHNPLFRTWKTSSFTDTDIVLHFRLMDILHEPSVEVSFKELVDEISNYIDCDESTIRKKLKEYVEEGIVVKTIKGKTAFYRRADKSVEDVARIIGEDTLEDVLDFYSEVTLGGVIGSFIMDKLPLKPESNFNFKHHYITQTVDAEVVLQLMECAKSLESVKVTRYRRKFGDQVERVMLPLKLFCSISTGRQYMMCVNLENKRIEPVRVDYVLKVVPAGKVENAHEYKEALALLEKHLWGISMGDNRTTTHVSFVVEYKDNEKYILQRLIREKRVGEVTVIDDNHARFDADVFDAKELFPWIRTFICRIINIDFEDKALNEAFISDIKKMEALYE